MFLLFYHGYYHDDYHDDKSPFSTGHTPVTLYQILEYQSCDAYFEKPVLGPFQLGFNDGLKKDFIDSP